MDGKFILGRANNHHRGLRGRANTGEHEVVPPDLSGPQHMLRGVGLREDTRAERQARGHATDVFVEAVGENFAVNI